MRTKNQEQSYEQMKDKLLKELKNSFRPEFLNRIDGVVVFHALNKEHIRSIVDLMLKQVNRELDDKDIAMEVTEPAKDFIGTKGYDEVFGARPLRRVIQEIVEDKLSVEVLSGTFDRIKQEYPGFDKQKHKAKAIIDLENENIIIKAAIIDREEPQKVAALTGEAKS